MAYIAPFGAIDADGRREFASPPCEGRRESPKSLQMAWLPGDPLPWAEGKYAVAEPVRESVGTGVYPEAYRLLL